MLNELIRVVFWIVVGGTLLAAVLVETGNDPDKIKQQAFKRGYMVECLGKAGYYWECEE